MLLIILYDFFLCVFLAHLNRGFKESENLDSVPSNTLLSLKFGVDKSGPIMTIRRLII